MSEERGDKERRQYLSIKKSEVSLLCDLVGVKWFLRWFGFLQCLPPETIIKVTLQEAGISP